MVDLIGSPMMEAMNVGSIDYGAVGDSPPCSPRPRCAIVYAAGQPITNGQGSWCRRIRPSARSLISGASGSLHQGVQRAQHRRTDAGKG